MSSSIRSKAKYRTLGLIVSMCLTVALGVLVPVGSAFGQAQTYGQWSTLSYTMPINPVHATLLHNGKILIVAGSGNYPANLTNGILQAAVWDLSTGNITVQSVSYDMFCSGMVGLADGREFIFGGTLQYDPPAFEGLATTSTFDLSTGTFTTQQIMAHW